MKLYFKQSAVGLGYGYFAGTTADVPEEIATKCIQAGVAISEAAKKKAEALAAKAAKKDSSKKK